MERPVAQSDLPGEKLSPTQPFPTKPAAFEIQELSEDNLIDFTPALRQEALTIIKNYKVGPLFNPPIQAGHPSTGSEPIVRHSIQCVRRGRGCAGAAGFVRYRPYCPAVLAVV